MPTQIGAMYREDDASGKRSKIYEFTVPLAALAGAAALLGRVDALETSVSALATSVATLQTADVSWDELTDKPAEFPPAAHTQDWSTITGAPATFPPGAHTQAWSTIIDTPTTLGGYGITNAYTKTEVDGFLTPITASISDHIADTGTDVHGLGTLSTQDANNINVTGGSGSGLTLTTTSVNGVTLVSGGTATKYLSEDGTYTTPAGAAPAGTGSEVQYRVNATTFGAITGSSWDGTTLTVVSLAATSITGAVNAVTLTAAGSASQYLAGDGTYNSITGAEISIDDSGLGITAATAQAAVGELDYAITSLSASLLNLTASDTEILYNNAGDLDGIPSSSWDGTTVVLPRLGIGSAPIAGLDFYGNDAGFNSISTPVAYLGDLQWGNGTPTYVQLDVDSNNLRLNYYDGASDNYNFSVDATTGDTSMGVLSATEAIIGTDPDSGSSAKLRVGGAGLFGGGLEIGSGNALKIAGSNFIAGTAAVHNFYSGTTALVIYDSTGSTQIAGISNSTGQLTWFGTTTPGIPAGGEVLIGGGYARLGASLMARGGFRFENNTGITGSGPGLEGGYSTGGGISYMQSYNRTTSAFGPLAIYASQLAFFSGAPVSKPTVSGSRGGNAALASLCTALANLGLITDSTS